MEKTIFESIINDKKAIKFGICNQQYFIYEPANLVIDFTFSHEGLPNNKFSYPNQRIKLLIFPISNLNINLPLKSVGVSTRIIVNSDNSDYAMTFLLTIDSYNRKIKVIICDLPELGLYNLTDEEKNGIEIKY